MHRLRIVVHALDRTGPPMLARAFLRWLTGVRPDLALQVVAVRGGDLVDDLVALGEVTVLLDPHEPWDRLDPDPARVRDLHRRTATLADADLTLLVSVAGAPCLPFLPDTPTVTWVVERGEDLHWLDAGLGLRERTTRWVAGATGTRAEVEDRLGLEVHLAPEFVEAPPEPTEHDEVERRRRRATLGAGDGDLLVLGAGIATHRKAPDLFVETALAHGRAHGGPTRFVWLGGERDPLFHPLREAIGALGLASRVRLFGNVTDVDPWLAAADVVLHPARLDAFPLVCLHAAAVGTPVIGFQDVSGLEEMFGDAVAAAAYPDLAALADLVEAQRSEPDRLDLAARQRERVHQRHTSTVGGPVLLAHLDEALAEAAR